MMLAKSFYYASLVFITATLLVPCYADTNVLENPGFESSIAGWTARGCSISAVTSPTPHGGTYCARATGRTATWQGIQQSMRGKMVVGQTYTMSAWVRISSGTATVKMSVEMHDDSGTHYANPATGAADSSNWVQITGPYTLNVTGTLTGLLVYFESVNSSVDIYVDDASVYGPTPPSDATGQVNVNTRYQEIEGFGAAGGWYENWVLAIPNNPPQYYRNNFYDTVFGDLGLDIYRVRNTYNQGTGGATYMSNSGQIVAAGLSRNPNLKILISSWSPPTGLKSTGSLVGGTLAGGPSSYVYSQFADWWGDSITAWSGYGVDADYISIQNECDFTATWDSCRFDPTQNSTNAGYDEAFEAVYNDLYSRFGSSMPKMLAPEATGFDGASDSNLGDYISAFTNQSHVYGYAHHLYNPGNGDFADGYHTAMANFAASYYDSKPLFQTEYSHNNSTFTDAMNLAMLMHNSLVVEGVASYLYWDLFWETPGGLVSFPSYGSSSYTIRPVYYAFKHYAKFTDPGWQRVYATTNSPSLRISAYISPGNDQLSAVIINTSATTAINLDLSFTGFTVADGDVYRSSSSQPCVNIGPFTNPISVPANTITTLALAASAPDTTPPEAPTGLSATGGELMVTLNWNDNTEGDLAGYNVYRSLTSGSGHAKINGSLVTSSDYIDNNVEGYVPYYYVVTALDTSVNESNDSNEASATPTDTTAPAAPTNLTALAGDATVSLNWNDNGEADLDGYNIYRSTTPGSGYVQLNGPLLSSSDYIDNSVTNGTVYYYVVTAVDIFSNESGYSGQVSATPNAPIIYNFVGITAANTNYNAYACDVDQFPFEGIASYRNTQVEATNAEYTNISIDDTSEWATVAPGSLDEIFLWVEMKINEPPATIGRINLTFDGYTGTSNVIHRIFVLTAGADWTQNASWTQVGSDQSIPQGTYYTMTRSITSGISSYIDGTGRITWAVYETTSNVVMHVNYLEMAVYSSADTTAPLAPTGLSATADNNMVNLDWNDNNELDVNGYNVYRSTTQGSGYGKINVSLVGDSNYIDNDVNNGTQYYYVVTAADTNDNESVYSIEASATPDYQDCNDVIDGGDRLVSDINGDCYVDFLDVEIIAGYWLHTDCAGLDDCENADLEPEEPDGDVDFFDFSDFAIDWLNCNEPQGPGCIQNW